MLSAFMQPLFDIVRSPTLNLTERVCNNHRTTDHFMDLQTANPFVHVVSENFLANRVLSR
jgi:hypothetical protein